MVRNTRIGEFSMDTSGKNAVSKQNCPPARFAAAGFTYIALLVLIIIMGVVLASTGEVWHLAVQREKEQELLFVGDQFRRAIKQYAMHSQSASRRYPMSLDDLLKDERYPNTQRYLRKIYIDPITGSSEWGLLKGVNGEIFGVYSLSQDEPLKKHSFSLADASFDGKIKYSDWVFIGLPMRYGSKQSMKL